MAEIDDVAVKAIAEAVADRLQTLCSLPHWPQGRGTLNEAEAAAYLGIGMGFYLAFLVDHILRAAIAGSE